MAGRKRKVKHKQNAPKGTPIPVLAKESLIYNTKEYFNISNLHGVRYIVEKGRPFTEKFMWFCFVMVGIVSAIVIIISLWEKFQTNPTITGLDTDFHSQLLTFPTVMICPERPSDTDIVNNYVENGLGGDTNNTALQDFLHNLTALSYSNIAQVVYKFQGVKDQMDFKSSTLRKVIFDLLAPCNKILTECRYKDAEIDCCEFFKPAFTEHGYCYIFNTKYTDTLEEEKRTTFQSTLFETDKKWNLRVLPTTPSQVFLHSFEEGSGWDFKPQVLWETGFAVDLLISIKQTYTTEQVKQLSVSQRKCIFADERKMKYRNESYTFTECMRECRIKSCLKFCGCVPPFYVSNFKAEKHCNMEQLECISKHVNNITDVGKCLYCELGCYNTVFEIEKFSKTFSSDAESLDYVNVEYLTWPIIRYKREVLFGWVDLLVSFGGIAGLFLGFSLLSSVEIVYYFTLRACCMVQKNRKELESIVRERQNKPDPIYELDLQIIFGRYKEARKDEPNVLDPKNVLLGSFYNKIPTIRIEDLTNWSKIKKTKIAPEQKEWKVWSIADHPPYGGYLP